MNVLIVHAGKGFYGGAEEVITQLCKYLYTNGHKVILVAKDAPFWRDKPEALVCNSYGKMGSLVWGYLEIDWPDVINVHNFPATLAAFPTKKPIVWMCNEPPELFTNWKRKPIEAFNRWWVRKSNMKVVVATEYDRARFEALYGITPTVLPYGIDYEFWSQGTRAPREGPIKLLQVGTITPYKNQLASIKTLAGLRLDGIDATLTLAGSFTADSNYFMDMQGWIRVMSSWFDDNFWKRISYVGQVSREQVRELYYTHDILLHPVKEQGGWLVPFEAICTGLPVIVTDEFPAKELVYRTGNLVSPSEELTEVPANLIKNYDNFAGNDKAKQWVKENLTWEKYGEGMLRVFKEAL